jgi:hypothetical protein
MKVCEVSELGMPALPTKRKVEVPPRHIQPFLENAGHRPGCGPAAAIIKVKNSASL